MKSKLLTVRGIEAALHLYKPTNLHADVLNNIAEWSVDCMHLGLFKEDEILVSSAMWPVWLLRNFERK